jgi:hypothetical protein
VPKTAGDASKQGYCWFRKGWKDANDIFVGVHCGSRVMGKQPEEEVLVWGFGERHAFFWKRTGAPDFYEGYADGSGVVTHDENAVAVGLQRRVGCGRGGGCRRSRLVESQDAPEGPGVPVFDGGVRRENV